VLLDIPNAPLLVSQPLSTVVSEMTQFVKIQIFFKQTALPAQFLNELFCSGSDVSWELNSIYALENNVVGLHRVSPCEGRGAGK
jgi:hypothetical protein